VPADETAYQALARLQKQRGLAQARLGRGLIPHADAAGRLQILSRPGFQDEKLARRSSPHRACRVFKEGRADTRRPKWLERLGIETDGAEELVAVLGQLDTTSTRNAQIRPTGHRPRLRPT